MLPSLQNELAVKSAECRAWTSSASDNRTPQESRIDAIMADR